MREQAAIDTEDGKKYYAMAAVRRRLTTLNTANWRYSGSPDRGVKISPRGGEGLWVKL
jgi:hypothetical protein